MPRIRNDNTRELLLQQGAILLRDKGYHGTGLKEILTSVNVPKGSFYHYFNSKEDYVAQVITHYAKGLKQSINEFMTTIAGQHSSVLAKLEAVYFHVLDLYEQDGCHSGCLIGDLAAEVANTSNVLRESIANALLEWQGNLTVLIEHGQKTGDIRDDISANDLANILWNLFEGSLLKMKVSKSTEESRRSLKLVFDNFFTPVETKTA